MKKITIKNNQGIIIGENILNDSEVLEFKEKLKIQSPYGKPEHQRELTPRLVIRHDEIIYPAPVDANGNKIGDDEIIPAHDEIIEATYETVPSEYVIEEVDITAEVETERIRKETKHSDRVNRVGSLKNIDWATLNIDPELKRILKLLVKEAIKDDE